MESSLHCVKNERVWDPLVRLFHWSLVAAFATAWWGRGEVWLHEGAGKFILGLIIFRAVWGLIGTGAARFENFLKGPRATLFYFWDILRGRPAHYTGHNPAGAVMIAMLLVTLSVTTVSGVLMTTTKLWGNGTIEYIHGQSANLMLVLIAGHLLGVVIASLQHKENLFFSMVTGWKKVPDGTAPYLGSMRLSSKRVILAAALVASSVAIWLGSTAVLNASFWRMEKLIMAAAKTEGCKIKTISEPRIAIYPHIKVHYVLALADSVDANFINLVVDGQSVIQKKLQPDFPELKDCKKLISPVAPQPAPVKPPEPIPALNQNTSDFKALGAMRDRPFLKWTTPTVLEQTIIATNVPPSEELKNKRQLPVAEIVQPSRKQSVATSSTTKIRKLAKTLKLKERSDRRFVTVKRAKVSKRKRKGKKFIRSTYNGERSNDRRRDGGDRDDDKDSDRSTNSGRGGGSNSGRGSGGGGDDD